MPENGIPNLRQDKLSIYASAEADANRFNLICLAVLCVIAALSVGLNDLGVFVVDYRVMHTCMFLALGLFLLPIVLWAVSRDRKAKLEDERFKYVIVGSVYLGLAAVCVALSYHTVVLMALPAVMASQYRDQKRLFLPVLAGTVLLVPLGIFGGLFIGVPDINLLEHVPDTADVSQRFALVSRQRLWEVSLHHMLPRILGMLAVDLLLSGIPRRNARMLARQADLSAQVQQEMERRNAMQRHVIEDLAAVIESRDADTGDHVARTGIYVDMLLRSMAEEGAYRDRLTPALIEEIRSAAPLHDVGKIAVSDTILLKPARLTAEEFDLMKQHTTKGGAMIRNIFRNLDSPDAQKLAEEIAVSHHEKWDGSGYPNGLKGEEIPLSARVMAVADVYDALVSRRVYKDPIPPEEALDIICSESGTHFDPEVIRAVKRIRQQLLDTAGNPVPQPEK